jgi:predicted DNA-binding transcriptional regulator YafY
LRKLVHALPETFRAEAEKAASAIVLDPAHWGGTAPAPPPYLDVLQQAVVQAVQVRLGYRDRTQAVTERTVHPLGLVSKGTVWYLVADTDAGLRTFRVWRVQSVQLTNDPVRRPPGFDLAETWQGIVARLDEQRQTNRVEALADPSIMGWLRGHFGNRLTIGGPLDDGRIAVEIGFPPSHNASLDLAGYSAGLEVVNPPELREQLAAIGSRLVERYGEAS